MGEVCFRNKHFDINMHGSTDHCVKISHDDDDSVMRRKEGWNEMKKIKRIFESKKSWPGSTSWIGIGSQMKHIERIYRQVGQRKFRVYVLFEFIFWLIIREDQIFTWNDQGTITRKKKRMSWNKNVIKWSGRIWYSRQTDRSGEW